MSDRRRWVGQTRSVAILFVLMFLGICLIGYDPADPPGSGREPANHPPANPCGPVGAVLAHLLMTTVGCGSLLLLYASAVTGLLFLRRRRCVDPPHQVAGVALLVLVTAAGLQKFAPDLAASPPVGSGGFVGSASRAVLEGQFGLAGFYLTLATLAVVGLGLGRDLLIVAPVREISGLIRSLRHRADGADENRSDPLTGREGLPLMLAEGIGAGIPRVAPIARLAPPVNRPPQPRVAVSLEAPGNNPPAGRASLASAPPFSPSPQVPGIPDDGGYHLPPVELLEASVPPIPEHQAKVHARALLLEKTLLEFGCQVRVVQIDTGPVITQFEIELEAGLRVAKINSVANDLAIALAVPNVRIVSPIPNKTTVGIEVPNERRTMVRLSEVIEGVGAHLSKFKIPLFLGRDVKGSPLAFDLADMPHLLIAGRTGTGKSVCLNAMILSILMTRSPDEVKLILIDPKIVELSQFKKIPHLMNPVVTDMKKAEALLAWACDKMDERYGYLARAGVRNIAGFNQLSQDELYHRFAPEDDEEWERVPKFMPYIVIIIDEMGDLVAQVGKEVETQIVRLAQKARAAGIHLILATQKPTVDVITGLIKSNLPARIAFQVSSRNDSRVVLDSMGGRQASRQRRHAFPRAGNLAPRPGPGDLRLRPGRQPGLRLPRAISARVQSRVDTTECRRRRERQGPRGLESSRRPLRTGDRGRDPRRSRLDLASPARPRDRLRPRRAADRLHGRGRHCRRVQKRLGPRGSLLLGRVGSPQKRRRAQPGGLTGKSARGSGLPVQGLPERGRRDCSACNALRNSRVGIR